MIATLPALRDIDQALAERSLADYVRQAWPIVEPSTRYIHGWHIDAICEHLQAVTNGEIRNLLINVPPRYAKSLLVCVFWFTWEWTFKPETRWMFSSYSETFAIRDSLKCRRILDSPWYRQNWGNVFRLTGDQNQKSRFENDKTGFRMAAGVGGGQTGEGGDRIVVDDPIKALDAYSDLARKQVIDWWDETMSTRANAKTSARVIIMQRLHELDLAGHILERMRDGGEQYEHLCLPAEYEPKKYVTSIGWKDPRTEEGELLWPERFDAGWITDLKVALGSYGAAGQLQQQPAPAGGGLFKREWFEIVGAAPREAQRVRYWDKAGSTATRADYSAGVLLARDGDGVFYVENVVRGQWSALSREDIIKQTAMNDDANYGQITLWMEQEPGSGGLESAQASVRNLAGHVVKIERVTGDKVTRAMPFVAQCEARNVKMVKGDWIGTYLDELMSFPYGRHDDQVDAAAGAFNKLVIPSWLLA